MNWRDPVAMKSAAEWWLLLKRDPAGPGLSPPSSILDWIHRIQADAWQSAAEAQRESDALLFGCSHVYPDPECRPYHCVGQVAPEVADAIRSNPLVPIPGGEMSEPKREPSEAAKMAYGVYNDGFEPTTYHDHEFRRAFLDGYQDAEDDEAAVRRGFSLGTEAAAKVVRVQPLHSDFALDMETAAMLTTKIEALRYEDVNGEKDG